MLFVVFVLSLSAVAWADSNSCRVSPRLVGQCFAVHGRFFAANGTPTFRLWRVGTKHVLGVLNSEGAGIENLDEFPPEIRRLIPARVWDMNDIYGDYMVCPLTRERPGWMQFVCIAGATHLVSRPR